MRLLVLLAATTTAATGVAPSSPPITMAEVDVPADQGPQQVIVQTREFAGGAESGWHTHPGIEIATVVDGELELHTAAGVLTLEEGDSFTMPRGVAHNGVNREGTAAAVVVTLVVDKGKPLRAAAPKPAVR